MTLDQYISAGASIGAFLAAVATFLTVWQMAKQRRATYTPDILIMRATVVTLHDKEDQSLAPLLRWRHLDDNTESESHVLAWSYYLSLVNIGMGAATDVSAEWGFPMGTFVEKIRERTKEYKRTPTIEYKNGTVSIKNPLLTCFWSNQQDFHLDYLLPASIDKQPVKIVLPSAYVVAVAACMQLFLPTSTDPINEEESPNVPPLTVKLSFNDIAGERHTTLYDIEFEWHMFTPYEFEATLLPKKRK